MKFDGTLISLVLANLIVIVYAYYYHWQLNDLLIVYWWQSVIIGVFQFFKILDLKNFSTDGLLINGHAVSPTTVTKIKTALFFACHYGLFHVVYLVFITSGFTNFTNSLPLAGVFGVNHLFSYIMNRQTDSSKRQNLGTVMFKPYLRIIPMHLTIIFGSTVFSWMSIVLFQLLKTGADVLMHLIEHQQNNSKV